MWMATSCLIASQTWSKAHWLGCPTIRASSIRFVFRKCHLCNDSFKEYAQRRRATNETEVTKDEFHSLYYHRLGTKPQRDVLVADFRELDDPNLSMFVPTSEAIPNIASILTVLVPFPAMAVFCLSTSTIGVLEWIVETIWLLLDSSNTIYYLDLKAVNYKIHRRPSLTLLIHDTRAFFVVLDYDHETESALGSRHHKL